MQHRTNNYKKSLVFIVLVVMGISMFCFSVIFSQDSDLFPAQQSSGNQLLESAEKFYYNGEFDKAKELLNGFLAAYRSS